MKLSLLKILFLSVVYLQIAKIKSESEEIDEDEASKIDDDDDDVNKKPEDEEESVFHKLNVFRIRSEVELGYLTELMDFTILQFYYLPYSTNSKKVAEELIRVNKRLENLAIIAAINCDEFDPPTFKHCKKNDYSVDSFPKLRLYVPPEKRFDYESKELKRHLDMPYTEKEMKETNIFNFITKNIPNKSVKLNSYNIVPFLNSDSMNKIILFTNKHYPGVIFRGLTTNFYDRLLFGTVHESETELVKKYNITSFPTLVAYKTMDKNSLLNEPETHYYTLNPNNVNKIIEFLSPFALMEKRYTTTKRGIPDETGEDLARTIEFMEIDKLNFMRFFERYQNKKIMVLFHTKNKLKVSVKRYLMESHDYFLNVFFNCKGAEKEFCQKTFGVTKFPTLRLYPENTFNSTLPNFADFEKYHEINTASNITFISDFNEYIVKKTNIANSTEFNFRFSLGDSRDKRKLIVLAFLNDELQEEIHHLIPFKLLASLPQIQKHVDFIIYEKPDYSTIQEFKITRFPFYVINYYENELWKSIPLNPDILFSSFKSMIDNILYHKLNREKRKAFTSDVVAQIYDNNQLNHLCSSTENCVLAFFNGINEEKYENMFDEQITKLEVLASKPKYKELNWGWVNSTCQNELAEKFTMPNEGGIVIYQKWKEVYSRFIFPTDDVRLLNFFEKTVANSFVYTNLKPEELVLNENDCALSTKKKIVKEEKEIKDKVEKEEKQSKEFDTSMKTDL